MRKISEVSALAGISNYINKVVTINNIDYEIKWIEVDQNGNPIDT